MLEKMGEQNCNVNALKNKVTGWDYWDIFCLACIAFTKIEATFPNWKILCKIRISSFFEKSILEHQACSRVASTGLGCLANILYWGMWAPLSLSSPHGFSHLSPHACLCLTWMVRGCFCGRWQGGMWRKKMEGCENRTLALTSSIFVILYFEIV